jgi:hypothetical protein
MLAALLANNQNVSIPATPPMVKIDRGGGGQSWPGYEIVDIIAALRAFPEALGEHPVARAARRMRFIEEALPQIKGARESREGAAFLMGAEIGTRALMAEIAAAADAAAAADEERHRELDLKQMIAAFDTIAEMRAKAPRSRGQTAPGGIGIGSVLLLVGIGVGIGWAISRRR